MSKIEFIAYDKLKNEIVKKDLYISCNGQVREQEYQGFLDPTDRYEIMLYIGLYSTDTVEKIYEGYIVEFDDSEIGGNKIIGEVSYCDDLTLVNSPCFGLWTKKGFNSNFGLGKIKILGNIYQHKNLLD